MAADQGVEPCTDYNRHGFQDRLAFSTAESALRNLAGALRFERRISGLESDVLPLTLCSRKKNWLARKDSNLRSPKTTGLQPAAFAALPRANREGNSVVKNQKGGLAVSLVKLPAPFNSRPCFVFLRFQERETAPAALGLSAP